VLRASVVLAVMLVTGWQALLARRQARQEVEAGLAPALEGEVA
jgi:hypothetical protein